MPAFRRFLNLAAFAGLALFLCCQAGCRDQAQDAENAALTAARTAFIDGDYLASETGYQNYLQAYPIGKGRLEAWQRLADVNQFARNAPAKAATILETAFLEFGSDPDVGPDIGLRAARIRLALRDYEHASKLLEKLLKREALSSTFRAEAMDVLLQSKIDANDLSGATALLQQAVSLETDASVLAQLHFRLALLYLQLDASDKAEALLRSLYDNPGTPQKLRARAGFFLASILEARRQTDEADRIYASLLGIYPNSLVIEKKIKKNN
ncbi:hypothetical protein [Solidesulfovibrio sp.]|uniref:tetratricopeptide repeat protein n=1 Tax=Solidesulfovibrio sp. TaxID=2910990 RepID=UPI00260328AE|nr:hypothetical protein [Solidesulfovibrio sp.]